MVEPRPRCRDPYYTNSGASPGEIMYNRGSKHTVHHLGSRDWKKRTPLYDWEYGGYYLIPCFHSLLATCKVLEGSALLALLITPRRLYLRYAKFLQPAEVHVELLTVPFELLQTEDSKP